jgi:ABC-2 type transport system permease protein
MFSEIPLGVVENAAYSEDQTFKAALESVSTASEDGERLFDLRLLPSAEEADALLEGKEIDGYISVSGEPALTVTDDGLNQTIIKSFLDQYLQTKSAIANIINENPAALSDIAKLLEPSDYTAQISLTDTSPTDRLNFFYALLGLACMYGCFQGLGIVTGSQANLSAVGARQAIAPVNRFRKALVEILAAVTVHFACTVVVVAYMIFALGTEFGDNLGFVALTCLAGSILGVSLGTMVASFSKWKLVVKTAVLISVSMIFSYFSGLMVSGVNYTVAQETPVLAWINPAARITDAFYCLYYYDGYDRFFLNLAAIIGLSLIMMAVTSISIRRQRYESI